MQHAWLLVVLQLPTHPDVDKPVLFECQSCVTNVMGPHSPAALFFSINCTVPTSRVCLQCTCNKSFEFELSELENSSCSLSHSHAQGTQIVKHCFVIQLYSEYCQNRGQCDRKPEAIIYGWCTTLQVHCLHCSTYIYNITTLFLFLWTSMAKTCIQHFCCP